MRTSDYTTLKIGEKEHSVPVQERTGAPLLTPHIVNELAKAKDGRFSLVVGGFSFLGEGSGPFECDDDQDPERRAYMIGPLMLAGQFDTLEEAEDAGEAAIGSKGCFGIFGDSYVIPESANMRIMEPIPPDSKIVSVDIAPVKDSVLGAYGIAATFDNGTAEKLFSFYPDEIRFYPSELIGLTEKEANQLKQKKEKEYIGR